MNIQNICFDDAATLAMGEAFDRACKTLRNFGSAVPAIIADRIIEAAKNGERDPRRLYEQALKAGGISMQPPTDQDYGDRNAWVKDPFDNVWYIAAPVRG